MYVGLFELRDVPEVQIQTSWANFRKLSVLATGEFIALLFLGKKCFLEMILFYCLLKWIQGNTNSTKMRSCFDFIIRRNMDIILFKWALKRKRMQLKLQMDHSSCRLRLNLQKILYTYKMHLRLQQRDAFESAAVTCRHCNFGYI